MTLLQSATAPRIPILFVLGIAGGGVATLAMDVVMARVGSGRMPPRIASGVLTDTHPDDAPERLASAVHYVAGLLTGALFVWLLVTAEVLLGPGPLAGVVAAAALCPLMVGFFAVVVLPRSRGLARQRVRAIRRAWAIEAVVYVTVLAPLVAGVALAL
jgi:hypothetical protein